MGNKKAVPRLLEMLKSNPKSVPTVVRALGKIGDAAATEGVLQALDRSETDIRVEGMSALARLADDRSIDAVRAKILPFTTLTRPDARRRRATRAISELDTRFGTSSVAGGAGHADPGRRGRARRPAAHAADRVGRRLRDHEDRPRRCSGSTSRR